ncbi:MAG: CapA family protein, partial [Candidatus Vogelbacteria bacterium]|nr:CapA family protein [Candidatus Vogelbacteria bacterium]
TDSFNVVSLGDDKSASMLVAGEYTVMAKEIEHRSNLLGVVLPYSVAFAGNYFIHGTPLGKNNLPDPELVYSVRLNNTDAEKTFEFSNLSTRVVVSSPTSVDALTLKDQEFLGFLNPKLSNDFQKISLSVKAKAYSVNDLDSGLNIVSRGGIREFPIASVSKLITAMVVTDSLYGDDIVQISKQSVNTYGHQGNLSVGEKFKVTDLLNCLLLESSNDAAEAFAERIGRNKFITLMNSKVRDIGMLNTKFSDPSGLSKLNTSTPEDLYRLIAYIEENRSDIVLILTKQSYKVLGGSLSKNHLWLNRNRLVRENNRYYIGGKDGFTSDALQTFAGAFSIPLTEFDHKKFSVAILKSSDRNGDVDKIMNAIISALKYKDGTKFETVLNRRKFETTTIEPEKNISLMFVGDIMMDRGVRQMIDRHGGGDFSFPFEFVPFLKDPDILFGNLEGPVSNVGYDMKNLYSFRMDPRVISALSLAGFDALSVANNHIGDWGLSAFEDTLNRLKDSGILAVGGGYNGVDARTVKVIERNGIKIGFLGFSDVGPSWLSEKENLPSILSASDPQFKKIINDAAKKVDHLVVSIHFGEEYQPEATQRQRELAHAAIDAGARIIIGHHPHVAEEVEKYKGGVIDYSLGNFIFDQPFSKETMTGDVLEIILDKTNLLEVNQSQVSQNNYFQPSLVEESGE